MHFEVLVEDKSGEIALNFILEKILGANNREHSWKLHPYKGIGRIPGDLHRQPDPRTRVLLNKLPALLRGYGRYERSLGPQSSEFSVVVVVDLDRKNCTQFKRQLLDVLEACDPRPTTLFRIAIEESEAWLLGDTEAVRGAYPKAKASILRGYVQDSICGTWEVLADAVFPGGSAKLRKQGYPNTGTAKCEWAQKIAPRLDVERNRSKSFQVFRDGIKNLATMESQATP